MLCSCCLAGARTGSAGLGRRSYAGLWPSASGAVRRGSQPLRVSDLVVEIQHRRDIFVLTGQMTSADADQVVLSTGSVNLRRFEQRPAEVRRSRDQSMDRQNDHWRSWGGAHVGLWRGAALISVCGRSPAAGRWGRWGRADLNIASGPMGG